MERELQQEDIGLDQPEGDKFAPWRADIGVGALFFVLGGLLVAYLVKNHLAPVRDLLTVANFALGISMFLALYGLSLLRQGLARSAGKRLEERMQRRIAKAVHPDLQVDASRFSGRAGADADIFIHNPKTGQRWVVEIKAAKAVEISRGFFSTSLRRVGGSRGRNAIKPDQALAQAQSVASAFSAVPVLWFPAAKEHSRAEIEGVTVVIGGTPKQLLKAAGIPRRGWF